jgi:hypothetical protein
MTIHRNSLILALSASCLLAGKSIADDKIDFAKQIYPIIKESCSRCHRPPYEEKKRMKKPKADLVMTNKAALMKGGENGPVIIPGKPDESPFLKRILLPLTDDKHEPPQGKTPQVTTPEKEILKKWIAQGADFGSWTEDPAPQDLPEWDGKEYPDTNVRAAK